MTPSRVVLAVATVVTLAACRSDATAPWEPVPDVVSVSVVTVYPSTPHARVLVDDMSHGAAQRYFLVLSPTTAILKRQPNGALVGGRRSDIVTGTSVRARRTGIEMRSLPPQYPVTWIEVTSVPPG